MRPQKMMRAGTRNIFIFLLRLTPSHQHHLTEHNFQIFIFKLLKISTSDLNLLTATKSYIKLMISSKLL